MYQHCLLIYSDYSIGKRIAFHKSYESVEEMWQFFDFSELIKHKFKQLTFSFHHIQTEVDDVNLIERYDKFFKGIEYYSEVESFISLIEEDTTIKPIDIVKMILCKKSYTQLEIEKILYFCYCEYLKICKKPLFKEEFEAWTYGPVMPEVYQELRRFNRSKITIDEKDKAIVWAKAIRFEDYDKIKEAIDITIQKYGEYSSGQLVSKTHEKGSPWDRVFKNGEGQNDIISKEIIEEYIEAV